MPHHYGLTLRNAKLGQIQTVVGASGVLKIFSGAEPVNTDAADPSGLLVSITLPSTFLSAVSGVTEIVGTWSGVASASGDAASFRIYDGSNNCHIQGNVTSVFGGGLVTLDSLTIASGQTVTVATFAAND